MSPIKPRRFVTPLRAYLFALAVFASVVVGTTILDGGAARAESGLIALADALRSGTPPPPYNDPSLTTTNALGGLGRTQGWTVTIGSGAVVDVMADAAIPSDIKADVEAPSTTSHLRFVTVMRVPTSTATSVSTVCGRLGPDVDTTPDKLSCPELQDSDASTGGCFLFADGLLCQETLRPIVQCDSGSYASCHIPYWFRGSTDVAQQVHVTIAW